MVDKKVHAPEENKDRYYTHQSHELIPEGEEYPSVTTILRLFPKDGLFGWYSLKGTAKLLDYRGAVQNKLSTVPGALQKLEEVEKELAEQYASTHNGENFWASAYELSEEAKNRGTAIHGCIETWAKTGELKGPRLYSKQLKSFREWVDNNNVEVVASEIITFSNSHKYAGRCDLVCKINGKLALVDIKVSKANYESYGLQLSAYRNALKELGGDDIEHLIIVRIDPISGILEVVEYEDGFDIFLSALDFWNKLKRKTKKRKNAKSNRGKLAEGIASPPDAEES